MTVEAIEQTYVAIRDITLNNVGAYRTGDTVGAEAVEGPDAWLVVGEDVAPRPGTTMPRPVDSASQPAWAAYAVAVHAAPAAEAEGLSRAALIRKYGHEHKAPASDSEANATAEGAS